MAVAATGVLLQLGPASASPEKANRSTTGTKRQVLAAYAKLPLAFVPNVGQLDRRVRYAAQAGGSSFFFTRTEAVLALRKGKRGVALRLGFLDANPAPAIAGARPGTGRVNYLLGSDPARWHANLPTYGEIVYRDLWPGTDMHLRGQNGTLEYEFHLAPGADVSRIRLGYRGQQRSHSAKAESSASRQRSDSSATPIPSVTSRSGAGGSPSRAGSRSGAAAPTGSPSERTTPATRS
jgi:hypothetical protein